MGNVESTAQTDDGGTAAPQSAGISLYRFLRGTKAGSWELVSSAADYSLYDAHEDSASKPPEWHLDVEGAQEGLDTLVDDQFQFEPAERRVTFAAGGAVWALAFGSTPRYENLLAKYNKAVFENRFGVENTEEAQKKVFGDVYVPRLAPESEDSRQQWVEDMDEDKPAAAELRTPRRERQVGRSDQIHGVVMGGGDRSFVLREGEIDVLRNVQGGVEDMGLTFKVTPPPRGMGGSTTPTFTPGKALLMGNETKMNMISPLASTSLFHADIETGKVVSEWSFQKDGVDVPIKDIVTDTKSAQMEDRSTFLGLDANRLARWDLRDKRGAVQTGAEASPVVAYVGGKDYARGTRFSCMATSGDGFVVVGSEDGRIRLYSEKTLTQAKTSIPGLGLPVTNVDVTYDGKWVLATTRSYLMVVKTAYKDKGSGKELCGFTSRMGGSAPTPRLLRLKAEDVALTGGAPLEKGHFTWVTDQGRQERWIVASCGNFTVLWNFRSVKVARPEVVSYGGLTTVTAYHLIPKSEHVVDSVFMHDRFNRTPTGGEENSMVVVTNHRVYTLADGAEDE